jgi:hypothetical protein
MTFVKVIHAGECALCHGQGGRASKGRGPDSTPVGIHHVPGRQGPTKSTYRWLRKTLLNSHRETGTKRKTEKG